MAEQASLRFADYLKIARHAPRVDAEDARLQAENLKPPHLFGGNFYLLWTAITPGAPNHELFANLYPEATTAAYEQLCAFTESETDGDLAERLKQGLEAFQPYHLLRMKRDALSRANDGDNVKLLDGAMGNNLGFYAIGFYGVDRLNSVLEELAIRMWKFGIEPSLFYKPRLETSPDVGYGIAQSLVRSS
ncbi:hypothetical protein HYW35_00100 [Candidatus Saccharibacteria bacterium]|nr:hypothetical protein [Candidatus Saccharibacteria bacterium]